MTEIVEKNKEVTRPVPHFSFTKQRTDRKRPEALHCHVSSSLSSWSPTLNSTVYWVSTEKQAEGECGAFPWSLWRTLEGQWWVKNAPLVLVLIIKPLLSRSSVFPKQWEWAETTQALPMTVCFIGSFQNVVIAGIDLFGTRIQTHSLAVLAKASITMAVSHSYC